ncbi:hypothetical protein CLOM_g19748 [Closterium sp. NIES-68]|nr:hypothetical protein CLOM_g19748 [Closterium sp. NIES-68]GJP83810.1 hypothetical protein CLOP_g13912 [Closterium sp. NIES-67]
MAGQLAIGGNQQHTVAKWRVFKTAKRTQPNPTLYFAQQADLYFLIASFSPKPVQVICPESDFLLRPGVSHRHFILKDLSL